MVVPGLPLPSKGRIWALDRFEGKWQLVHLKYVSTDVNNHTGSNLLKGTAMPFVFKQKKTVEIHGAAASVRLHDTQPSIYFRGLNAGDEDASSDAADAMTRSVYTLIKLRSQSDKRLLSTIEFAQVTGKAARSEGRIETMIERIQGTQWYKITPSKALEPGEYGLLPLPKGQNMFSAIVFDFAIDPSAPANKDVVMADVDTK